MSSSIIFGYKKKIHLQKKQINLQKKKLIFFKYEVLEKEDDLTIYIYSNKERQKAHNLVYQYFYDEFNIKDYDIHISYYSLEKQGLERAQISMPFLIL